MRRLLIGFLLVFLVSVVRAQNVPPLAVDASAISDANVKAEPNSKSATVVELKDKSKFIVRAAVEGEALVTIGSIDNPLWYQVRVTDKNKVIEGYIWSGFVNLDGLDALLNDLESQLNKGHIDDAAKVSNEGLALATQLKNQTWIGDFGVAIGKIQKVQGQYDLAIANIQASLKIWREQGFLSREANSLLVLGDVYRAKGEPYQALTYYQKALDVEKSVGDTVGIYSAQLNLAEANAEQGYYGKAEELIKLPERSSIPLSDDEWAALNNRVQLLQGDIYRARGDTANAVKLYTSLQSDQKDAFNAQIFIRLGNISRSQGSYNLALEQYNQALNLATQLGDVGLQTELAQVIGDVYRSQGRYVLAVDYYSQALAAAQANDDSDAQGTLLNRMGGAYLVQGAYEKAKELFDQALSIGRPNTLIRIDALINLGGLAVKENDPGHALEYYSEGYDLAQVIGSSDQSAMISQRLGDIYLMRGRYDTALKYLNEALQYYHNAGDKIDESATLVRRGLAYEVMGQSADAIVDYQAAIAINEAVLREAALSEAVTSISRQFETLAPYQRLAVLLAQTGDMEGALTSVERGRAILTRNELAGAKLELPTGADKDLIAKEVELRLDIEAKQKYLDSLRNDYSVSYRERTKAENALKKARNDYEKHLEKMQLRGGLVARQLAFNTAKLQQIQKALGKDTTLVLYAMDSGISQSDLTLNLGGVVFIVTAKTIDAVPLNFTSADVAQHLTAFAADRKTNVGELSQLYALLFAPIKDKLTTKSLVIVPDGILNYVPFAALQASDGRYVIDDYAVSTVNSATTLVLLKQRKETRKDTQALIMAQPVAAGLPRLENARTEALDSAEYYSVDPFINATEDDLRQNISGKNILQISAHAELDPFAPLYSVIHLAATDQNDGRVEVREIYQLQMKPGMALVVLSGCETGTGGSGEDFGLLTRAFLASGAQRVVASLWTVDDAATDQLITSFIKSRMEAPDDATALQQAMISIRQQFPDPYYWASFTLTGVP
jgi:CHAT domain-containing protein/Tfp pilus assembly protein PilF